ncbi:Flp pilus assembly protein CpaB [Delftia sp. CH05]|uniref:Flp pilus assembly protein CpaB n=1 Tax=Delftia sp. CH05 TaxID=2692194 RepID=UPI00135EFAFE|nr:Flp pilus assembly protein CpaB [Delftia sp. CH05]MXN32489.1 Flp pilus assembly protein CpaB [Delftia sp. CH05]
MHLTRIVAGLLIVLAIGLAFLAWMMGRQPQPSPSAGAPAASPPSSVGGRAEPAKQHATVVTARPIAAGQRITADDIRLVQHPSATADGFKDTAAVLNRTTLVALAADAPLLEQHLISSLALQLNAGQRALSIAIKEQMAAGHHVRPGDFVDVFFTLDGRAESSPVDTQTRLLLARSRVLAYGASSVENPPPSAAQRKAQQEQETSSSGMRRNSRDDQGQRPESAQTAVLAVPLEDVERLTLAEKYGQLTLALRHPDDMAVPDPSLFAALPTALQPITGRSAKNQPLQGPDRAFAGLRFKDLATGTPSRAAGRTAPFSGGAAKVSQQPRIRAVEVHSGATVQTVNY